MNQESWSCQQYDHSRGDGAWQVYCLHACAVLECKFRHRDSSSHSLTASRARLIRRRTAAFNLSHSFTFRLIDSSMLAQSIGIKFPKELPKVGHSSWGFEPIPKGECFMVPFPWLVSYKTYQPPTGGQHLLGEYLISLRWRSFDFVILPPPPLSWSRT